MRGAQYFNFDLIPAAGALLVPTRLHDDDLPHLVKACGRSLIVFTPAELAAQAVGSVKEAIAAGGLVVYKPQAAEGWGAAMPDASREELEALLALDVPIVPIAVVPTNELHVLPDHDHQRAPSMAAAAPLARQQHTVTKLQEAWLTAAELAFAATPELNQHLGRALLDSLKKHGHVRLHDGTDDSSLTYFEVLAAALALAAHIKKETDKPRVAIVLPPGKAGAIANLAVVLAGKVPVNLNFTAGKNSIESALKQSEVDKFLTVDLVVRKMQSFPWPPIKQLILLERVMPSLKKKALLWGAMAKLLPSSVLAMILGLPKEGGEAEAGLLFTSGSSGEPKGVILSHRNLLANVLQFGGRLGLGPGQNILGCLPLFHSFGFTVTTWYPLLSGVGLVTYPTPLDTPKLASLIERHSVKLFCSTPTFLRSFLRKATREQLASLELIVTGAEKLPPSFAATFKETFGKDVLEGYGLTETSPATNVSMPNRQATQPGTRIIASHRPGSVGQLLPGLALRITDPNNNEPLPLNQSGMIWFKGANIFPGYLKQPRKTEEVIHDGWFRTGDIGRLDEDGFLYIEGRLSRFSKIGGEMVPHETVEESIIKAMSLENEGERRIAVVGIPDPDKGEALVLLSSLPTEGAVKQEEIKLRYALLDLGVPSLWIPKRIQLVQEIPLLASGKLDLKKCEELARMG